MSKEKKKITQQFSKEIVDRTTGEVLSTETYKSSFVTREPPYFKMFCSDLGLIYGLNPTETKCLYEFARNMSYHNIIPLVSPMREGIREVLGLHEKAFERAIKELKNAGVLIPVLNKNNKPRRGIYVLNPDIVAKGAWEDIQQLRMSIDYIDNKRYVSYQVLTSDKTTFSTPGIEVKREKE